MPFYAVAVEENTAESVFMQSINRENLRKKWQSF